MKGRIYYELPNGKSVTADETSGIRIESDTRSRDRRLLSNPEDQGNVIHGEYGSIRVQPNSIARSLDYEKGIDAVKYEMANTPQYVEKLPSGRRILYKNGKTNSNNSNDPYGVFKSNVKNSYDNSERRDVATLLPVIPPIMPDEKSSRRKNTQASYMIIPPVDPTRTGQGQENKNRVAYAAPNINDYLDMMEV